MKRKILVVGSGGREHALAKKINRSPLVETVYCAKGNPGMLEDGIVLVAIDERNHEGLIDFCLDMSIDWVIVGPEQPLLDGLVDDLKQAGIPAFGPSKEAAKIEGSKDFAKELMVANEIPTAQYRSFKDYKQALDYVIYQGFPIVIKADGLASGKGVTIAHSMLEAKEALRAIFEENIFGEAEPKVVIEEFLEGKEFSLLAFVSEEGIYPMVAAKDHKPIYDGDKGPNTGGMGAYSPVPYVTDDLYKEVVTRVLEPTIDGMKRRGTPFTGILYTGLILTENGPKVIEYNARLGDPETQVLLSRLKTDLVEIIEGLLQNTPLNVEWLEEGYHLGVVLASQGYPGDVTPYVPLPILPEKAGVEVFYAGVTTKDNQLVSCGGRVLLVAGEGKTLDEAHNTVYGFLEGMKTEGFYYRSDIGII